MRVPHSRCSMLNESCSEWVATYMRIGMETSPKLIVPEPIERAAIRPPLPARKAHGGRACQTRAVGPMLPYGKMGRRNTGATRMDELGLPRAQLSFATLPLMLPVLVDEVPAGPDWVFEPKLDG